MGNSKKGIYEKYGISYNGGKIEAPLFGQIAPLLVNGNAKLGKGVWTWSMLPGDFEHSVTLDDECRKVRGTCPVSCPGCYAQTGFYNMPDVKAANARKTVLARLYPDFVRRAILAQIEAEGVKLCRIHASGDFFSAEYVEMWREIVKASPACLFWSYTKNREAEEAFSDLPNINIVKSCVAGYGFNFGKCGYILRLYNALKAEGEDVYICRCGIDKNQHCTTCRGCSENKYVLFIEHSTDYHAEADPLFPALSEIIEAQRPAFAEAAD